MIASDPAKLIRRLPRAPPGLLSAGLTVNEGFARITKTSACRAKVRVFPDSEDFPKLQAGKFGEEYRNE